MTPQQIQGQLDILNPVFVFPRSVLWQVCDESGKPIDGRVNTIPNITPQDMDDKALLDAVQRWLTNDCILVETSFGRRIRHSFLRYQGTIVKVSENGKEGWKIFLGYDYVSGKTVVSPIYPRFEDAAAICASPILDWSDFEMLDIPDRPKTRSKRRRASIIPDDQGGEFDWDTVPSPRVLSDESEEDLEDVPEEDEDDGADRESS